MISLRSYALFAATLSASLSLLALTSVATPASAQVTTYNNRATFNTAASGLTTINFNDEVPAGQTYNIYSGATTTISGVTFTGNASLQATSPAYAPSSTAWVMGQRYPFSGTRTASIY